MAVLTEEQVMLRDVARSWCQEKSPVAALRRLRADQSQRGFDSAVWQEMVEMGWSGILIPESFGGVDLGYVGLGVVLEETGRTLTASPLVSTALGAASALLVAGNAEQSQQWLSRIAQGSATGALAIDEGAHHAPSRVKTLASRASAGWRLQGEKQFVVDGAAAKFFIVSARTAGGESDIAGISLFLVPADRKGVTVHLRRMADSRVMAAVSFDAVEVGSADLLGEADNGYEALDVILDRTRAGLAAEMLGSSVQAFETTLEYLKNRAQFGRIIGTFQGLQHRAAKLYADLELTRSCVEAALRAIDTNAPNVAALTSLAKARASELFHLTSNEMVQMHGGIGMTDEHDAGFYLKRARVAEALFGGASFHRDRYARLLGF